MEKLVIGILQAPYGLRGELKLNSLSGEADHFFRLEGESVTLQPVVNGVAAGLPVGRVIESVREVQPHLLIKFKGFDTPEAARALTGCEILVERSKAAPLNAGEYYVGELAGCNLVFQGAVLGVVKSVWESGASQMLETRIDDPAEEKGWRMVNIPFQAPFIGEVEITAKRIELLVDWILE